MRLVHLLVALWTFVDPVAPEPCTATVHDTCLQHFPGSCLHVGLNHGAQAAHLAALKGGQLEQLWQQAV